MNDLQKARRVFRSPSLSALWRWSAPIRGQVLCLCLLGGLTSAASLGLALVSRQLIDAAGAGRSESLLWWGICLAGIVLAGRGLQALSAWLRPRIQSRLQAHLQGMVTGALLEKEYAALQQFHSGEIVNRLFSDVRVVKEGMVNWMPQTIRMAVSLIGAASILLVWDGRFLVLFVAGGLLSLAFTALFRNPMKRRHQEMQQAEDALHAAVQETMENSRLVKASQSEARISGRLASGRARLQQTQNRSSGLSAAMNQSLGAVFDLSWLACNLWGCVRIAQGSFSYGSLVALVQLVGRIQMPITGAVSLLAQAYGVVSSAERLQALMNLPAEKKGSPWTGFDRLQMDRVSFSYENGAKKVLQEVSLEIHPGEFIGMTGESGEGKTTLLLLLLALYKPTKGRILVHAGARSAEAGPDTRGLFAYVPQGNSLLSGTLRENLTFFRPEATEAEIRDAIRTACLEELASEVGLEGQIGERGLGLSEGQAQRVAIARAIIGGAPILMLDEGTSALDEETEGKLMENLRRRGKQTVLLVTHRKAPLNICDRHFRLKEGHLLSSGRSYTNTEPLSFGRNLPE